MGRGTTRTIATSVQGDAFRAERANDLSTLAANTDDDRLYDELRLEPPPAASATNVYVGFIALHRAHGRTVSGDGAARQVTVRPIRAIRSSIDTAQPRAILSAASEADTVVALPAAPGAATWGWLLLYAQITYVDASEPTKGTALAFYVADPAYGSDAAAPNIATLPAHTSTSWNVPLRYIKSYFGQTTIADEDIIEVPASAGLSKVAAETGRDRDRARHHRRAHSSANSDPTALVLAGSSAWVTKGIDQVFSKTRQPAMAGRRELEVVDLEILIPSGTAGTGGPTAGTAGAAVEVVVDDSRDWRGANFRTEWSVHQLVGTAGYLAEDDDGVTVPANRLVPSMSPAGGGASRHITNGNSWIAVTPAALFGSKFWAGLCAKTADVPGADSINGVVNAILTAGTDGWGLYVDAATGALKFWGKRAGAGDGPSLYILLEARFSGR